VVFGASDISNITVWNDDAGNVTFRIDIPNRPALRERTELRIFIDADEDDTTGQADLGGIEFFLAYTRIGVGSVSVPGFFLGHWNGATFEVLTPESLSASDSGGVTFTINVADLGQISTFDFWVGVLESGLAGDFAPAAPEAFPYQLTLPPSIADALVPTSFPAAKAGTAFSARGIRLLLDNGEAVAPDTMRCVLKIAGKALKPSGSCRWRIPLSARGKRLSLAVTLTYDKQTLAKDYSGRVIGG
jgi:hypothetical protein